MEAEMMPETEQKPKLVGVREPICYVRRRDRAVSERGRVVYLPNKYRNYKRCLNGRVCHAPATEAQYLVLFGVSSTDDPEQQKSQSACARIPSRSPARLSDRR